MNAIHKIKSEFDIMMIANKLGLDIDERHGKATCNCLKCEDTGHHLTLYADSNRFFCFKCKAAGDQVDLYCLAKNVPAKTAILELGGSEAYSKTTNSHKSILEPLRSSGGNPANEREFDDLYFDIMSEMEITLMGKGYLNARGITDAIINKYGIGSIDDPQKFKSKLIDKYQLPDLLDSGLFDISKNGKPYCCFFMPAIVFPHWDKPNWKIKHLSTRNLSGENKSFKLHNVKSSYCYGQGTEQSKQVFIFEGIISGLSYELLTGDDNWLALAGTHLTPERFQTLQRQYSNQQLILALDPDKAGQDALAEIHSCQYVNWTALAQNMGFKELQKHDNGKFYDINDYLIHKNTKDGNK